MTSQEIIREHGLKATPIRMEIVEILLSSLSPLPESGIKEKMSGNFDRVTFYRAMKTMQESGIIHSVAQEGNAAVFALDCGHSHHHAHFICDSCHKTICLGENPELDIQLPEGYSLDHADIIIHGICDSCCRL